LVSITNSTINNYDDCVSFKPNSTNIVVSHLNCNGSHGISVGSLGQYAGETDIVANISASYVNMANAQVRMSLRMWVRYSEHTFAFSTERVLKFSAVALMPVS
jgi:hypothetical protein